MIELIYNYSAILYNCAARFLSKHLWDRHIRYKIYSIQNQRHQCHHRARRSLLQQHLACFLLSGSPGQAPILHCSVHGCQQGQAHIISLVKILAPDANHIIIPYSCARHKARTSKKQQQIKFRSLNIDFLLSLSFRDIIALVRISASICKS